MAKAKKTPTPIADPIRPTPERMAKGKWAMAKGMRKHQAPAVDITADVITQLAFHRIITAGQEQAARQYQRTRKRYLAELPELKGFKSCLNEDVPGYDDGDGNPDVIEEYRKIERELGHKGRREMLWVCVDNNPPTSLTTLRWALDVIEGM